MTNDKTKRIIDLEQKLYRLDGKTPIKSESQQKEYTVRDVVTTALLTNTPKDTADGEEKAKRFGIAQRMFDNPVDTDKKSLIEVPFEEATLIRKQIGIVFSTIVVGRMYEIIN